MKHEGQSGESVFLELLSDKYILDYLSAFSCTVQEMVRVADIGSEYCYLQERLVKQQDKKTVFYCVFDGLDKNCIGAIEIRDGIEHAGQLYCWLNEHYWGTGLFTRAMCLASHSYFVQSGAPFFTAHVDKNNKRSYYALKKCGFADQGIVKGPRGAQYQLVLRRKLY